MACEDYVAVTLQSFSHSFLEVSFTIWPSASELPKETGQRIHVFLFILNQMYLAAKSIVSRGSLLFKRPLITDCVSSK